MAWISILPPSTVACGRMMSCLRPRNFRQAAADADGVVGIFVTSKLSGTVANALATQAELPGLDIRIIDSQSTSMGMGFMVLAAARAAAEGKSLEEVIAVAEEMRDRVTGWLRWSTCTKAGASAEPGGYWELR